MNKTNLVIGSWYRLTVTKVVFECRKNTIFILINLRLTVTKVVFEFIYTNPKPGGGS